MKKQLKMMFVLISVVFGMFSVLNMGLIRKTSATYVEGNITQDTIWTLMESPFIVSNDVVVYSNATLNIESGVEVKFGGDYSLNVLGRLYANSTTRAITFTSNKENPMSGDWNAIRLSGTQPSVLAGCYVSYARDGIYLENGNVDIQNVTIGLCENGIRSLQSQLRIQNTLAQRCSITGFNITDSNAVIQNCVMQDNQGTGIWISGSGPVSVQKNTIIGNDNGIVLGGGTVTTVTVSENIVSANTGKGIYIAAGSLSQVSIINNTVSSNGIGFCISTPSSTYITNNAISYNGHGFLYEVGNHTANYNDVYGSREIGMEVSAGTVVNAEHNYWGDPSGPWHESLNPAGKGDAVGGEGTIVDLVFFLTKPIGYINAQPVADLLADKTWVSAYGTVTLYGTNSYDPDGHVDRYFFNFGDGSNSGWTTLSTFTHVYSVSSAYQIDLIVMDDYGTTSSVSTATINVNDNMLGMNAQILLNDSTINVGDQTQITVYVTYARNPVTNALVNLFTLKGGEFLESSGYTDGSGYFVTNFTAPSVNTKTTVGIVARATKDGVSYNDGSDRQYVDVLPRLYVQILTEQNTLESEDTQQFTVQVEGDSQFVANASATMSTSSGSFSPQSGTTDSNGNATFVFTAPVVGSASTINITASVSMSGYTDAYAETSVTVNPRTFDVEIVTPSYTLRAGQPATIIVNVTRLGKGTPVDGASIIMSSSAGNFIANTGITDITGRCIFNFVASQGASQITLTASVVKEGYTSRSTQATVTLGGGSQGEGGWPIIMILLIIVPIVIAVIVIVLIKMKVISVSTEEEQGEYPQ